MCSFKMNGFGDCDEFDLLGFHKIHYLNIVELFPFLNL
jgi:hypothetical protein